MKRGQQSLEFVLTYGWVFLVVLGTIGAMYAAGLFDFTAALPQKCDFLGQIECDEWRLYDNGTVRISIINDLGTDLAIYAATLQDGGDLSCTGMTGSPVAWAADEELAITITGCSGAGYVDGEMFRGFVNITFFRNHSWCSNGATAACRYTSIGILNAPVE
ncbi:MAG TPA: hypothetical protein VK158_00320 [Acidobacteriota bacterium]|nr:hypothetical protein [Acidobacteriota bacterium]